MTVMPRPSILSVEPYVGGESKIPGVNRIVKLSSNEGAFGPPPGRGFGVCAVSIATPSRQVHKVSRGRMGT